jgi:steroid delta-isomerase-like uncharacterized protein
MSTEECLAASRRVIEEAWNQGKLAMLDEICTAEFVEHDPSAEEDVRGMDALRERITGYRTAFPDLHVSIDDAFASGNEVVLRWNAEGTNDGELLGAPATHRHMQITGISIDRFDENGKIAEVWDEWDNLGMMRQLGMAPAEAPTA